ncbi:hypothetical protein MNBD_NITROSPINAE02-1059 [hydrothermal vent metagenome]|uniref:SxtJ n=1 Tax=hydrothermal vent metagenome TaxID=652676 RepID=A0A3B1C602_9ZZZZ
MNVGESKKELRTTWIGFAVIFGVIGSLLLWKERESFVYFYGLSGFFGFFAAVRPMALLPFYRLWIKFAGAMAWFNTRLLLFLMFFFIMTPMGLAMRLFGKDPMERKLDPEAKTYWKKRKHHNDITRYDKQY